MKLSEAEVRFESVQHLIQNLAFALMTQLMLFTGLNAIYQRIHFIGFSILVPDALQLVRHF